MRPFFIDLPLKIRGSAKQINYLTKQIYSKDSNLGHEH